MACKNTPKWLPLSLFREVKRIHSIKLGKAVVVKLVCLIDPVLPDQFRFSNLFIAFFVKPGLGRVNIHTWTFHGRMEGAIMSILTNGNDVSRTAELYPRVFFSSPNILCCSML